MNGNMLLIESNAVDGVAILEAETVACVVTSPPYYWQRYYGVPDELGLEDSPAAYVSNLVEVFTECARVLRSDGSLWVNIGDSFNNRVIARTSSHQSGLGHTSDDLDVSWKEQRANGRARLSVTSDGFKEKDLFGIPWVFAAAMRDAGWFVRAEVIWQKTYGNPDGAAHDRPSRTHETIFLFTRSHRYRFDKTVDGMDRSVWELPPGQDGQHGATFPHAIPDRCVRASSVMGDIVLDPFVGSGSTGVAALGLGREFIGIDSGAAAIAQARRNLEAVQLSIGGSH